jgi:hypothetical protein
LMVGKKSWLVADASHMHNYPTNLKSSIAPVSVLRT